MPDCRLDWGTIVGKKLIGFGKINPLHPEQWQFVDRPILNQTFLGKASLSAEGVQLLTLLPLPFFLNWSGDIGRRLRMGMMSHPVVMMIMTRLTG